MRRPRHRHQTRTGNAPLDEHPDPATSSPASPPVPPATDQSGVPAGYVRSVLAHRELFWQNVIREILTSLSALRVRQGDAARAGAASSGAGAPASGPAGPRTPVDLFDGRLAVITRLGQRIPIADVFPLLACAIEPATAAERATSLAVESTVFQVRTPAGEVYTLPLHEIVAFHALTQDLMDRLADAAARRQARAEPREREPRPPFGFAAFTSMMRDRPLEPAPEHPTE